MRVVYYAYNHAQLGMFVNDANPKNLKFGIA
jgi:hypothetical protein